MLTRFSEVLKAGEEVCRVFNKQNKYRRSDCGSVLAGNGLQKDSVWMVPQAPGNHDPEKLSFEAVQDRRTFRRGLAI